MSCDWAEETGMADGDVSWDGPRVGIAGWALGVDLQHQTPAELGRSAGRITHVGPSHQGLLSALCVPSEPWTSRRDAWDGTILRCRNLNHPRPPNEAKELARVMARMTPTPLSTTLRSRDAGKPVILLLRYLVLSRRGLPMFRRVVVAKERVPFEASERNRAGLICA